MYSLKEKLKKKQILLFLIMTFAGFKTDSVLGILVLFIVIILFGGPLNEEFGWRGFLLPRLQKKFHPVFSAVIVGVIWSLWHLPLFVISATGYDNSFLGYMAFTIILSIEITWIYNKTNGSLLFPILIHGIDNTYAVVLNFSGRKPMLDYIVVIVITVFIVMDMCKRTSKKVVEI